MKHFIALSALALGLAATPFALAQSPPPLPSLTGQQSQDLQARLDAYRRTTDERVARGEITVDERDRLLKWREWQIARQVAGSAEAPRAESDVPPDYRVSQPPPDYYVVEPAPAYVPYYPYAVPRYWGPRPYAYWGPAVCAGGFGRHFGGRICF